ncbi:MAG TPA: hypothetical protein VGS07_03855 [Thermoanaerobaculia bacterium]|nr:hypothetical protein [Thermoanaerobaculia bacterium]
MARTGRPKGTEYDDSRPLLEMAREKLKHPEHKPERLAKKFEHMAEGAHGPGSVARFKRLARKFKEREAELMMLAAKEPPAD